MTQPAREPPYLCIVQASQASRQLRQNLEEEGRHVTEFLLTVDATISPLQQVLLVFNGSV